MKPLGYRKMSYGGGFWRKLRGHVKHSERLRKLNRVACRRGRAESRRILTAEMSSQLAG